MIDEIIELSEEETFDLQPIAIDLSAYSKYRYNQYGGVDCDRLLESGEVVPCTLSDAEIEHIQDEIAPFDDSEITAIKVAAIKAERVRRLAATDFYMLPDAPPKPDGLLEWRQAMRDITKQPGFPDSFVWPIFTGEL